jgi:hypothetical protein
MGVPHNRNALGQRQGAQQRRGQEDGVARGARRDPARQPAKLRLAARDEVTAAGQGSAQLRKNGSTVPASPPGEVETLDAMSKVPLDDFRFQLVAQRQDVDVVEA